MSRVQVVSAVQVPAGHLPTLPAVSGRRFGGGVGETRDTKRVGLVAQNFYPLTGRRACEFEVVA